MGSLRGATSAEPVEVESRNTNEADWREPCDQCGFPHPGQPCPASRLGDLLANKYRLMSILGVGGMGVVYEARHELFGRRFAMVFAPVTFITAIVVAVVIGQVLL